MSQEQQEEVLQNSEPQSVDVTVNVGGDSRAERFLGTFDQISRLSLDIDRNYGNKRVLTDFPLVNDGAKWTGTINKLIVGFDYTVTGHAYKCTECPLLHLSAIDNFTVSNFAGSSASGNQDGFGDTAKFNLPTGITVDRYENVYVADKSNNIIRKIYSSGLVETFAGSGEEGSSDGMGDSASFNAPYDVAADRMGNIYVADYYNHKIRKINPSGLVETFAGSGSVGSNDGMGNLATFNGPKGVFVDLKGNVLVADTDNNLIRKINPNGYVTTIAGSGEAGSNNGEGHLSSFYYPRDLLSDSEGNIFVLDTDNSLLRKINSAGYVSTIQTSETLKTPKGIALDAEGNLYVADYGNHKIRIIDKNGTVNTLAGTGSIGNINGQADISTFNLPRSIAFNSLGKIYIADTFNNSIRKISANLFDSVNDNSTYKEIFRGDTQHTVTEGTNSLNLRLSPLLDDRDLTVPRITRINRPFQMVASTSDNITVEVDTVKKDGSSAVDATLSYRFRSVDNDSLPLDNVTGGSFSPASGDVIKSGSSYPDISTTYTAPDNDSTMKLQVRVSNELEIGVTSHFNVYVTHDIETQNTIDTNPVIEIISA